jgi:hypothetical protein
MALSDPSWKMLLLRLDLRRLGHTGVPRQDILDGRARRQTVRGRTWPGSRMRAAGLPGIKQVAAAACESPS